MTDEIRHLYVVAGVTRWSSLTVAGSPLVDVADDGSVGFLPVFETREQAEEFSEGRYGIITVQAVAPPIDGAEDTEADGDRAVAG